jgi:hypothetical protein
MVEGKFLGEQEHDESKMIWAFCASIASGVGNKLFYGRVEGRMRADGYANMVRIIDKEYPDQRWTVTALDFGPDYPR